MSRSSGAPFPPTPWSEVNQVADADPERARRAFAHLCGYYRQAMTQWMRLQGLSPEDAEDAAHDFLAQWLARENPLQEFRRGDCSFRGFLRVCLRRFHRDWLARRATGRRGGGKPDLPLNDEDWVQWDAAASEQVDFAMARQIHDDAIARLKADWANRLADGSFDRLQAVALGAADHPGYESLAAGFDVSVGTVKSWIFRLRREYHEAFREAVRLQADPSGIDDDVVHLHGLLLRPPAGVTEALRASAPASGGA